MSSDPESFENLRDFHQAPKMDDLKPISHKEFNEFMKLRLIKARFSLIVAHFSHEIFY